MSSNIIQPVNSSSAGGVFGSEFHIVENLSPPDTTSMAFMIVAELTVGVLPAGTYEILADASFSTPLLDTGIVTRIQKSEDGAGFTTIGGGHMEKGDYGDITDFKTVTLKRLLTLAAPITTLDLRFQRGSGVGGETLRVKNVIFSMKRVL